MNTFTAQYKALFFLSWILFYLIFPTWALPITVNARALVFFGLLMYFCAAYFLLNRWIVEFRVDKPVLLPVPSWRKLIKDNLGLVIICLVAVLLHISPLTRPILILGDETIHLQGGLLIYDYVDVSWHRIFQAIIWMVIILALVIKVIATRFKKSFSDVVRSNMFKNISFFLFFCFFVLWFLLLKDINYNETFIRYPPVSKLIYFLTYSAFGIDPIFPRIIQLIFYLLSAGYIYKTINLFHEKETALLGALLYLFLPITFAYAHLAELANGTIFFVVACSFYFLSFVKTEDNRDLLIATYLIGIGCLYKKLNLIMFIICIVFLVAHKIRRREFDFMIQLKILFISLVPIIPWMILTKNFSWRNYIFQLSNLTSLDAKIVTYIPLMASNLSGIIFALLVLSICYICFYKRDTLTSYFGLLFIVYYFFIVSDMSALSPRFSMVFYPTIIIYISLFVSRIIESIKWRHAFKLFFASLMAYLIIISSVAPLNSRYLTIMDRKLQYFPSAEAMKWVKENVKEGEKILTVRIMSYNFYRVKYDIDNNRINGFWYDIEEIATPDKLKAYYRKNKISYVMFPYSPKYQYLGNLAMLQYLKENPDREFVEVKKFNLDDKLIYIYKLKDV